MSENNENTFMKLTLDDGTEVEWPVLDIAEINGKEYIALTPGDGEDVYLYEYSEDEDGVELGKIEDEDFEEIAKEFEEILSENFEFIDEESN